MINDQYSEYSREKAREPFKKIKLWAYEADGLGMNFEVKTRYGENELEAIVEAKGFPEFLSDPAMLSVNSERQIIFDFLDSDGFKIMHKSLKINEFTTKIGSSGKPEGLHSQFDASMSLEEYKNISSLKVGWNLQTNKAPKRTPSNFPNSASEARNHSSSDGWVGMDLPPLTGFGRMPETKGAGGPSDHCAPGLSKHERLRRLEQRGTVRQDGDESYTSGSSTVAFSNGTMYYCK